MIGDNASDQAYDDEIIKKTMQNIVEKENKILRDFQEMKRVRPFIPKSMKTEFEKHLEERKMFLSFKLQSHQDQCKSLYKLLEYVNALEMKDNQLFHQRKADSDELLDKISCIEEEMQPLAIVIDSSESTF
jgi:hypothetical protein